MQFIGNL